MARQRDPLAPLEFIVNVIGTVFLLGVVVFGPLALLDKNVSLGTIGAPAVCTSYSAQSFTTGIGGEDDPDPLAMYPQARPARSASTQGTDFETCDEKPTTTMRTIADAGTVLDLGFSGAVLALLWRLTRTARRRGLFTAPVARQVSVLGWVLLAGYVAVGVLRAALDGVLVHLVVGAPTFPAQQHALDLSITTLVVGFGLLTLGRVMSQTVAMRDEIDATV